VSVLSFIADTAYHCVKGNVTYSVLLLASYLNRKESPMLESQYTESILIRDYYN
jgi:hypothetical protein